MLVAKVTIPVLLKKIILDRYTFLTESILGVCLFVVVKNLQNITSFTYKNKIPYKNKTCQNYKQYVIK